MAVSDTDFPRASRRIGRDPRRLVLAAAGIVSAGCGAVGAVVPGMPTTVFLIIASFCFTKSCPWLEDRLLRNRLFAPYMAVVRGERPLDRRGRGLAVAAMWTSIGLSLWVLHTSGSLPLWLATVLLLSGIAATFAIVRFQPGPATR